MGNKLCKHGCLFSAVVRLWYFRTIKSYQQMKSLSFLWSLNGGRQQKYIDSLNFLSYPDIFIICLLVHIIGAHSFDQQVSFSQNGGVESNINIRIWATRKLHCYLTFLNNNVSKYLRSSIYRYRHVLHKLSSNSINARLPLLILSRPALSRHWSTYKSININKDHWNHME